MPYVEREGRMVVGLYAIAQPARAQEFLADNAPEVIAFLNPPAPVPSFLARDLFGLLTIEDFTAIKAATANSDGLGLLWASLQAQGDAPIVTDKPRFLQGWAGLKAALGDARSAEIAAALGLKWANAPDDRAAAGGARVAAKSVADSA